MAWSRRGIDGAPFTSTRRWCVPHRVRVLCLETVCGDECLAAIPGDKFVVMSTERQKMLAGEMYDPLDPELIAARARARDLCHLLNATRESEQAHRRPVLRDLFGKGGDTVWMQPPFYCDYGSNIELGERVFFNFNCTVLDVCPCGSATSRCSGHRCRSTRPCSHSTPSNGGVKSSESRSESGQMCGRRRSNYPRRRTDRVSSRDRSRQRCHARYPRRRLRRR
jgi:maltose acetyltransferase-like protein